MKFSSYFFLTYALFNLTYLRADFRVSGELRQHVFEGTMIGIGAASFLAILATVVQLLPSTRNDAALKDLPLAAMSVGGITVFCTLLSSAFEKKLIGALVATALSGYCVSFQFAHKDNKAYGDQEPPVAAKRWWFLAGAGASMVATTVGWSFLWSLNKYYIRSNKPLFSQSWQSIGIESSTGIAAIAAAFWRVS